MWRTRSNTTVTYWSMVVEGPRIQYRKYRVMSSARPCNQHLNSQIAIVHGLINHLHDMG